MTEKQGFCQTRDNRHVVGRNGYFPIGLVQGQYGNMPTEEWLGFIAKAGFDGCELASWQLDLRRADTDEGAIEYALEIQNTTTAFGLEVFSIAAHLQGQALGDEPSVKTLQFVGGQAVEAYKAWRQAGNDPPENDPFFVPDEVGRMIREQAENDLVATIRLAGALGKINGRHVVVSGFVGSPANRWSHWFGFPPLPSEIGGCKIPELRRVSLQLLTGRFFKVFTALAQYDAYFGLECHPSEAAMGDIASAREFLEALSVNIQGFNRVGFNLDCSHIFWQGVDPLAFIREFQNKIYSVHIKGVQVSRRPSINGLLGGHQPMGHADNGWNFVTAGSDRDCIPEDEVLTELRRIGYKGALSVEWEDNDADQLAGAVLALNKLRQINVPPSGMKHDEALKAKE